MSNAAPCSRRPMFFAALAISYRVGHPEGSTGNNSAAI
jgi:hypothetical protein